MTSPRLQWESVAELGVEARFPESPAGACPTRPPCLTLTCGVSIPPRQGGGQSCSTGLVSGSPLEPFAFPHDAHQAKVTRTRPLLCSWWVHQPGCLRSRSLLKAGQTPLLLPHVSISKDLTELQLEPWIVRWQQGGAPAQSQLRWAWSCFTHCHEDQKCGPSHGETGLDTAAGSIPFSTSSYPHEAPFSVLKYGWLPLPPALLFGTSHSSFVVGN